MSDLGLIIPKVNLFSNHKHGITAADEAQNSDSFQQQLAQALGASAQPQSTAAVEGADDSGASLSTTASTRAVRAVSAETAPASTVCDPSLASGANLDQFRQYTATSLPQQMFYTMLSRAGISKDQFEAMTPQQQAEVTQQLQQRLQEAAAAGQLGGTSGLAQGISTAPVQAAAASAQTSDALSGPQTLA